MAAKEPVGERRLNSIELARAVASLSVAWLHLTNTFHDGPLKASGAYGWLGNDVFFAISGFVIPYTLHKSGYRLAEFWRFLARRCRWRSPACSTRR